MVVCAQGTRLRATGRICPVIIGAESQKCSIQRKILISQSNSTVGSFPRSLLRGAELGTPGGVGQVRVLFSSGHLGRPTRGGSSLTLDPGGTLPLGWVTCWEAKGSWVREEGWAWWRDEYQASISGSRCQHAVHSGAGARPALGLRVPPSSNPSIPGREGTIGWQSPTALYGSC